MTEKYIPVESVKDGDLLDLQNDKYADPLGGDPRLANEYQRVCGSEMESDKCIRLDFEENSSYGFPLGHLVKVVTEGSEV